MKVLEEGSAEKEMECPYCGTVFSYLPSDVQYTNGNKNKYPYLICPVCEFHMYPIVYKSKSVLRRLLGL